MPGLEATVTHWATHNALGVFGVNKSFSGKSKVSFGASSRLRGMERVALGGSCGHGPASALPRLLGPK